MVILLITTQWTGWFWQSRWRPGAGCAAEVIPIGGADMPAGSNLDAGIRLGRGEHRLHP
jgi:hypothetical protein